MHNGTLCNSSSRIVNHLTLLQYYCRFKLNALQSLCFAYTPKLYKFSLQYLHINKIPFSYDDCVKYLGFTLVIARKDDDDMLRRM